MTCKGKRQNKETKKYHSREEKIEKGRGVTDTWGPRTAGRPFANHECIPMIVILHLGSHSGRGHPICSPFSKGGYQSLTQVGSMRRCAHKPFGPQKRTHRRNTRTHRHSLNHTPLSRTSRLSPPSLRLLVRWLLWERTDVVKAVCLFVCEGKYLPAGMYCTVSE